MKHFKKLAALACAVLVFAFFACSAESSDGSSNNTNANNNSANNSGNSASSRTEATGKIGRYEKPYEVGDIVFSDGSASPYSADLTLTDEQKSKAIAVIFYVGTECSNADENGNLVSRTLGVGLVHNQTYLQWCTGDADAYSKAITTIQCPASGTAGALSFTGDKDGSDNLEQIAAFEGVSDTATEAKYPAFYFAKNYKDQTNSHVGGTSYENGWYLPTLCELFYIWRNKATVDVASSLCGGALFGSSCYWSSSQSVPIYDRLYFAERLYFGKGNVNSSTKICMIGDGTDYYVCAIRSFN